MNAWTPSTDSIASVCPATNKKATHARATSIVHTSRKAMQFTFT